MTNLASAGAIDSQLARQASGWWMEAARAAQIDLAGFDPDASLEARLSWARSRGLDIGGILARQSTKMQDSIDSQIREDTQFAAQKKMYTPPEYMCVDIQTGRKSDRDGLNRMREILRQKLIDVLIVYKVSRLFRSAHLGYAFLKDFVVDNGMRAISVSQGIDTNNKDNWKVLTILHGLSDEMLLTAIADHVRSGLVKLFTQRYLVGALTLGYRGVEVPDAPPTKLGRPRRMPQVDPVVARFIVTAFESIRDGMAIRQAWRQWLASGGPCDPRSRTGKMTYNSFRRLLSNPRYVGCWAFGRKRNVWSGRKDSVQTMLMPDTEVKVVRSEELRIVSDELYYGVQETLAKLKLGPRGPKGRKDLQLWDLVTDVFFCARCEARFYQYGNNGDGMACKNQDLCPCMTIVNRQEAVRNVCKLLGERLMNNDSLITDVVIKSREIDSRGDAEMLAEADDMKRQITGKKRKIEDLMDLAGQGTDEQRGVIKARIRTEMAEMTTIEVRLAAIQGRLVRRSAIITSKQVHDQLRDLAKLLEDGASGRLGSDLIYRAAAIFRALVSGRIAVHVEPRPGRKWTNVRGTFSLGIMGTLQPELGIGRTDTVHGPEQVEVYLRKLAKRDVLAPRVHELMDIDGLTYRQAAKVLQDEGHKVNSGVVWQIYRRYYEMIGQPVPQRAYNNGRPRKPREEPAT